MKKIVALSLLLVMILCVFSSCMGFGDPKPFSISGEEMKAEDWTKALTEKTDTKKDPFEDQWYEIDFQIRKTGKDTKKDQETSCALSITGKIYLAENTYDMKYDLEAKLEFAGFDENDEEHSETVKATLTCVNGETYAKITRKVKSAEGTYEKTEFSDETEVGLTLSSEYDFDLIDSGLAAVRLFHASLASAAEKEGVKLYRVNDDTFAYEYEKKDSEGYSDILIQMLIEWDDGKVKEEKSYTSRTTEDKEAKTEETIVAYCSVKTCRASNITRPSNYYLYQADN